MDKIMMYSQKNICLVPTYRCNANCPFCYAKDFQKQFKKDMSWAVFTKVISLLKKEGKNEISFLGGEPTIWPHIDKAVEYLKNHNMRVNFFTNGIIHSNYAPDSVLINIYNFFQNSIRASIVKSINYYKANKTEVILRYNLVADSSQEEDKKFFEFAQKNSEKISISPSIPYRLSRKLGPRIFNLAKEFYKNKKIVKIARAIPICLFSAEEFKFLRANCSLRTECYSRKNVIINPDGKSLFPCVNIPQFEKDIKMGLKKIDGDYKKFFNELSKNFPFGECSSCPHAKAGKCQAGCLAMRSNGIIYNLTRDLI